MNHETLKLILELAAALSITFILGYIIASVNCANKYERYRCRYGDAFRNHWAASLQERAGGWEARARELMADHEKPAIAAEEIGEALDRADYYRDVAEWIDGNHPLP